MTKVQFFADLRCILSLRFTRTSADACFACSKKLVKKHSVRLIKVQINSFCFELDFELNTFNVFMPALLSIKEPHKVVLKLEILTWKLIFPAFSGELPILFKKLNQLKASEKVKCAKPPRRPMWELLLCWKIIFCATKSRTALAFSLLPAFLHSQTQYWSCLFCASWGVDVPTELHFKLGNEYADSVRSKTKSNAEQNKTWRIKKKILKFKINLRIFF